MHAAGRVSLLAYWLLLVLVAVPAWGVVGLVAYSIATADPSEIGDRLLALAIAIPAVGIGLTATIAAAMAWSSKRVSVVACVAWVLAAGGAGLLLMRGLPETDVIVVSLGWIAGAVLLALSLVLDLARTR